MPGEDLLKKTPEDVGKKPEEPGPPDDKGKALAAYWAKKNKVQFYLSALIKAGVPTNEPISEKKFLTAVKDHEKVVIGTR